VPSGLQANFNGDALDDLVLPLVAYQIKTAVNALHTVNEQKGRVRGPRTWCHCRPHAAQQ
jgi:hypothetical protein